MRTKSKILVVDDEENIRSFLQQILIWEGYDVTTAESGEMALAYIVTETFDLALIDLKMPKVDGIQVLAGLRQHAPDTVAIILTAHGSFDTAIQALRYGAHDYLCKPCNLVELKESIQQGLANRQQREALIEELEIVHDHLDAIRASVNRRYGQTSSNAVTKPTRPHQQRFMKHGPLTIDFLQHLITLEGQSLPLTNTEFELMVYLIQKAPQVVSPQELLKTVQGYDGEPWEANVTIRSHIYHIRKKIKTLTGLTDIIRTMRGVGYKIG